MIVKLSKHKQVSMANEWFPIANLDHFWIKWRSDVFKKHKVELPVNGALILEVGCGSGLFLQQLDNIKNNYILEGCDLEESSLLKIKNTNYKLYLYDILDCLDSFKDKYDAIFLMDVLEHIPEDKEFLKAVLFHLKPGGSLYINVPANNILFSKYDEVAGHMRRYSVRALIDLTKAIDTEDTITIPWGFLLIPIALARKFFLVFVPRHKVINVGFKPPNIFASIFFEFLRLLELGLPFRFAFGTSILMHTKKKNV